MIQTLQGTSARECEQKLARIAPETCLPKEKMRPITQDKTLIQFSANHGLVQKAYSPTAGAGSERAEAFARHSGGAARSGLAAGWGGALPMC